MDTRLRELERAAGQGDAEASARLLTERLRLGTLHETGPLIAAHCGHAGARVLHPRAGAFHPPGLAVEWETLDKRFELWVEVCTRAFGREAAMRAAFAAAGAAMEAEAIQQDVSAPMLQQGRPWRAVMAARTLILVSASVNVDAHERAAEMVSETGNRYHFFAPHDPRGGEERWRTWPHGVTYWQAPWMLLSGKGKRALLAFRHAKKIAGEDAIRAAICSDLIEWALSSQKQAR
jgi:hypothetical protein